MSEVDRFDLADLERRAQQVLSGPIYDFFAGGAEDELGLLDNVAAWKRLRLRPHVLRDVSAIDTTTSVLGSHIAAPVLIAPTSFQKLVHPRGEAAMAEGASKANTIMVVSTRTTIALDDIASVAPEAPRWFQLYILNDRGWTKEIVELATELDYRALVLTVDAPVVGRRRRDEGNSFNPVDLMPPAHLPALPPEADAAFPTPADLYGFRSSTIHDPSIGIPDVEWLAEVSRLPVVVKGILRADDAEACVQAGASAVAVSNHGGRQLDSAVATADALEEVVEAVKERAEVYIDGGIRSGTDVLKAVALGATAAMVGRPAIWGLAVDGAEGVQRVIRGLGRELELAMALSGAPTLGDITSDLVVRNRS